APPEPESFAREQPLKKSRLAHRLTWIDLVLAAAETSAAKALNDVGTAAHEVPDEAGAVVLDHHHDGALVQAEVALRYPDFATGFKCRVVTTLKTVLARDIGKVCVQTLQ